MCDQMNNIVLIVLTGWVTTLKIHGCVAWPYGTPDIERIQELALSTWNAQVWWWQCLMWEVNITASTVLCSKLDRWNFCVNTSYLSVEHSIPIDPCTSTVFDLTCSPWAHPVSSSTLWAKCSILLTEMFSKSPGFIKW